MWALLGGSFDPIHEGHLAMARAARDVAGCERVILMVARHPPHKRGNVAPPEERLAMVRLAIESEAGLEASDLELLREGPSYTIDTVRELKARHPEVEWALVLGSDSLPDFPKWRDAAALLRETRPLVVPRRGTGREVLAPLGRVLGDDLAGRLASGWLDVAEVDVSSTDVRARLVRSAPAGPHLPAAVERYARARGLYDHPET